MAHPYAKFKSGGAAKAQQYVKAYAVGGEVTKLLKKLASTSKKDYVKETKGPLKDLAKTAEKPSPISENEMAAQSIAKEEKSQFRKAKEIPSPREQRDSLVKDAAKGGMDPITGNKRKVVTEGAWDDSVPPVGEKRGGKIKRK